jgi:hypothetical protein
MRWLSAENAERAADAVAADALSAVAAETVSRVAAEAARLEAVANLVVAAPFKAAEVVANRFPVAKAARWTEEASALCKASRRDVAARSTAAQTGVVRSMLVARCESARRQTALAALDNCKDARTMKYGVQPTIRSRNSWGAATETIAPHSAATSMLAPNNNGAISISSAATTVGWAVIPTGSVTTISNFNATIVPNETLFAIA